jgi:type VI secretion system protein ImpM
MQRLDLPGWYGKIPALGDFVSRRLAPDFIQRWDAWLQRGIAASPRGLKEFAMNAIGNGAPWRFALLPGVCGDQAWVGVILPSVDRVGRHFPLTIALALTPHPGLLQAIFKPQHWFLAIEQLAIASIGQDAPCLPDDLERQLAAHPFPVAGPGNDDGGQQLCHWWQQPRNEPLILTLPAGACLCDELADAGWQLLAHTGAANSIWWQPAKDGATAVRAFAGLPPDHCFAALFHAGDGAAP